MQGQSQWHHDVHETCCIGRRSFLLNGSYVEKGNEMIWSWGCIMPPARRESSIGPGRAIRKLRSVSCTTSALNGQDMCSSLPSPGEIPRIRSIVIAEQLFLVVLCKPHCERKIIDLCSNVAVANFRQPVLRSTGIPVLRLCYTRPRCIQVISPSSQESSLRLASSRQENPGPSNESCSGCWRTFIASLGILGNSLFIRNVSPCFFLFPRTDSISTMRLWWADHRWIWGFSI